MKALLTIEEASDLIKLSIKTLYTYAEKETIPHIKLGRRVLFSEDQLEEWVNSCSIPPAGYSENPIEDSLAPAADGFEEEAGAPVR